MMISSKASLTFLSPDPVATVKILNVLNYIVIVSETTELVILIVTVKTVKTKMVQKSGKKQLSICKKRDRIFSRKSFKHLR